ncbi:titin isoform X1 [Microplitis demolitor]|uniref:titin isoform X1 n=1 Tax=Microplitis demolitor TaxID=69319 RepID=UPI00235B7094|nr:titin isoform X1 [Microplitis demolitor]
MLEEDLAKEQKILEKIPEIQEQDIFRDTIDTISDKNITEVSSEFEQDDKSNDDIKHIEKTTARPLEELIEAIVDPTNVRDSTTPENIEEINILQDIGETTTKPDDFEQMNKEEMSMSQFKDLQQENKDADIIDKFDKEEVSDSKAEQVAVVLQKEEKEMILQSHQEVQESIPKEDSSDFIQEDLQQHKPKVTEVESLAESTLQQAPETFLMTTDSEASKIEDVRNLDSTEIQKENIRAAKDANDVQHYGVNQENICEEAASGIQELKDQSGTALLIEDSDKLVEGIVIEDIKAEISSQDLLNRIGEIVKSELDRQNALEFENEILLDNITIAVKKMMIKYPQICQENVFEESVRDVVVDELQKIKGSNHADDILTDKTDLVTELPEIEKKAVMESAEFTEEKVREIILKEISKENISLVDEENLLEVIEAKVQQVVLQGPKVLQELNREENIREVVVEELHKFEDHRAEEKATEDLAKAEELIVKEEVKQQVAEIVSTDIVEEKIDDLVMKELEKHHVEAVESNKLLNVVKTKVQELILTSPEIKQEEILEEQIKNIVTEELQKAEVSKIESEIQDLVEARASMEVSKKETIIQPIIGQEFEEKVKDMIIDEFKKQQFYPVEDPLIKEIKIKIQEEVLLSSHKSKEQITEEILRDLVSVEVEKHVADLKDVEVFGEAEEVTPQEENDKKKEKAMVSTEVVVQEETKDLITSKLEDEAQTSIQDDEAKNIVQRKKQDVLESVVISEGLIRDELKKQDLYPVEDPLVKEIKAKVEEEILRSSLVAEESVPEEIIKDLISVEVNKHVAELIDDKSLDKAQEIKQIMDKDDSEKKEKEERLCKEDITTEKTKTSRSLVVEGKIEERTQDDEGDNLIKKEEILKSLVISDDMIRNELKKQDLYPVEDPLIKEIKAKVHEEILLSSHTTEENIPEEIIRDLILVEIEKYAAELKDSESLGKAQEVKDITVSSDDKERKEEQALLGEESSSKEETKDLTTPDIQEKAKDRTESDKSQEAIQKKQQEVLDSLVISEDMIRNELKKQHLYPVEDPLVKDIKTKVQEVILLSSHTREENIPEEMIRDLILAEIEKHVAELKYDEPLDEAEAIKENVTSQDISDNKEKKALRQEEEMKNLTTDHEEKTKTDIQQKREIVASSTISEAQIAERPADIITAETLDDEEKVEDKSTLAITSQEDIPEEKIHKLIINEISKQNAKSLVDDDLITAITIKVQQSINSHPEIVKEDEFLSSVKEIVQEELQNLEAKLVEVKNFDSAESRETISLKISEVKEDEIPEEVLREIIIEQLEKQHIKPSEESDMLNVVKEKVQSLISNHPEVCTVDSITENVQEIVTKTIKENARILEEQGLVKSGSEKLKVQTIQSETEVEIPEEVIHEMIIEEVHKQNIQPVEENKIIEKVEAKIQQLILQHPEISGLETLSEKVHDFVEEIAEEENAKIVEVDKLHRAEEEKQRIEVLQMPLAAESQVSEETNKIVDEKTDQQTVNATEEEGLVKAIETKTDVSTDDSKSKEPEKESKKIVTEKSAMQDDKVSEEVIEDSVTEESKRQEVAQNITDESKKEGKEAEEFLQGTTDEVSKKDEKVFEDVREADKKVSKRQKSKEFDEAETQKTAVDITDKKETEKPKKDTLDVVVETVKKQEELKEAEENQKSLSTEKIKEESGESIKEISAEKLTKEEVAEVKKDETIKSISDSTEKTETSQSEDKKSIVSKEGVSEKTVHESVAGKPDEDIKETETKSKREDTKKADGKKKKIELLRVPSETHAHVSEEMVHEIVIGEVHKLNIEPLEEDTLIKAVEFKIQGLVAQFPQLSKEEIVEESVKQIVAEQLQEEKAKASESGETMDKSQVQKTRVEVLQTPATTQIQIPEEMVHDLIVEELQKQNVKMSEENNFVKAIETKVHDLIAQHPEISREEMIEESVREIVTEELQEHKANILEAERLERAQADEQKRKVEVLNVPSLTKLEIPEENVHDMIIEELNKQNIEPLTHDSLVKAVEAKIKDLIAQHPNIHKSDILEENVRDIITEAWAEERASIVEQEKLTEAREEIVNKTKVKVLQMPPKEGDESIEVTEEIDQESDIKKALKKKRKSSDKGTGKKDENKRQGSPKDQLEKDNSQDIDEKNRSSLKKKPEKSVDIDKNGEEKRRTSLNNKTETSEDIDKNGEEKRRSSLKKKSEKSEDKDAEEKTRTSLKKKSEDKDKNGDEKRRSSLKKKSEKSEDKDAEEKIRTSLKKKSEDKDKNGEEKRRSSLKKKSENSENEDTNGEEKRRTSLKNKTETSEDKDVEEKTRTSLKKKSEKSEDKDKHGEEKRRSSLKKKSEKSEDKDVEETVRTSLKKKTEKSEDKVIEDQDAKLEETKVKQLENNKMKNKSEIADNLKKDNQLTKKDDIKQLDKPRVQKTEEKTRDTKEEYQKENNLSQLRHEEQLQVEQTVKKQPYTEEPITNLPKSTVHSELDSEFSESSMSTLKNVSSKERPKRSIPPMIEIDYDESSPREPLSRRSNISSRKYRDLESIDLDDKSLGVYSTDTSRTSGFSHGPRDRGKKPSFCTKLTDRTAAESSRIKLTCAVLGEPEPTVYWLKDGKLLPPSSNRHGTTIENGMVSLELYTVRPSDSGEYTCVARNLHGQACTEAKLKVYAGYEPTPTTPTFTRSIKDTYLRDENTLVLECRVRGQPTPAITWLKDGQLLEISDRYQQCDLADGICRLKIFHPDFYDSGLYTCRAENDTKLSDHTSHLVNFEASGRAAQSNRSWRGSSYQDITSTDKDTGRPRFSSYLTDHSVPVGGTIALQVEVKGVPPPDITWMRADKKGVIAVPKARTFADSGVYTLVVPDATEYETGTYVCRASNPYGHVDTTANIEVVSGSMMDGGKPAMFMSRPPDKVIIVAVGEDVSVSFRTNGVPKPKVIWMKGLRDITSGPRSYKEGHDDYVRLTLKRACPSDEGTYCILVKNRYGCDRSFFSVQVKQRARSLTPSPDWGPVDTDNLLANIHDKERSYVKQVPGPISSEPVVIDGGRNWLALTWGKAQQRGSAPVVAYRVDAWLLGGEGGARWVELGVTPINAFDAFNLRPGEEYKFRITPRNRYGWGEPVTMTNSVTVREVVKFPEFTKILPGQLKALAGTVLNLDCEVSGDSLAHVKWYRDTTEIENGQDSRFTTYFNGTKCTLMIGSISENDSGRYVCEATNAAGRVSTFARVQVVEDPKIVEADLKLRKMKSSEVANEERPPEFTMRLRDRRVQATYPVRLTCQVTGYPEPEVTWYKYREELYSQENISIWNDEAHFHTLEISRSTIDDSGIYMARAKNIYGSVSCRCHLTVDKGIRAYIAPEFLRHLDSIYTVKAGGELRMTAQIEAYPTVGVTWHRDGHRLRPSRDVVMTLNHDGSVELDLAHVTPRDAGLYCCTATNEVGQTETTTRVTVLDNDDTKDVNQSLAGESEDIPFSKEPVFVTKPLSTEAFEGDTVIISCEVIGDPKPEVIWLRDFLRPDYYKDAPHFRRVGAGPQYRLEIPYAKLDFTGTYSIISKNCHGEAKAVISLQIYARGQGKEDSDMESTIKHGNVQTLPVIKRPLRDLRCCDGDAITLVCKLHAKPEPNIRWEKGGKILPLGGDFTADFDGETSRLSIHHVYPEDEGEYTCVAYNELGKAFTSACVIVDVPEGKETALSRRLTKPPGFLSSNSTPISTPRSTPVRSLSPSCACKREVKPVTKIPRGYTSGRRPRMPTSPKFYAVPHNKVAEEGETVRFQCAIAGHPVPWVTWDKDGISITPTARITFKESDDVRVLEINEITHEDAGLYRVTLENDVGRTEATARLEIIKGRRSSISRPIRTRSASPRTYSIYGGRNSSPTPRSDSRLQPPRVSDTYSGGRGTISPTLPRWHYRNGKAVKADEKMNTETSSAELNKPRSSSVPRHCLMEREKSNAKQVPPATESLVKSKKTRACQQVASPTQLPTKKTSIPVRRKSPVKSSKQGCKIESNDKEKNGKDKNFKKKAKDKDKSLKEELKSPVILTVPADIIALRGAKVMLLATYDGYPNPSVKWLRKGRDVTLNDKTEIETSAGLTCLTLSNVTAEEAGKYEVFIENKLGKDSRHVNVTVEGPPEPPAGSPAVQTIKDSRGVTLSWRSPVYDGGCAVTGYSVEMRRGEEPCWIAVAEAKHSLSHTIRGLDSDTSYRFRVRAENIHGLSEPGMESETVIITSSETRKITTNISGFYLDPDEDTEDEVEPVYEPCVVTPEPGFLFDERYNVLEELGKGKYGIVRRIVDKSNGSSFAAKFIRTIKAKDRQQVNDEINIMNMLRHPKLLRLIAAFEGPKEMIMVTEYISGGELFERVVADDFTLTEKDSILFVRQICLGVEYMHDNLVVHLDLKPENIMCQTRTSHRIKLIDFGLAQTLKVDTPVRVLFGTPEFIPPEIIGFEPIGTESDMWSVGVICYVLLTGLSPFMGDNDAETFANITRADFDFDDKAFHAISEEAKDFISRLLIKRKESRMSAKECLKHPWLAQRAESMSRVALPTDKLKKFIVRRKWQKTGNAIRALGRMAILSANTRRNTELLTDMSKELSTPTSEIETILTDDSLDGIVDDNIDIEKTSIPEFLNGKMAKDDSDELQITELSSSDEYADSHDNDNADSPTIIETQRSISPDDYTKIDDNNKISNSDSLTSENIDNDLMCRDFKILSDENSNKTDTFISEVNSSDENLYKVDISLESLKTTTEIQEEFSSNFCSITSLHINEPFFEAKEEITISLINDDKDNNKFVDLIDEQNLKTKSSIIADDNDNNKVQVSRPDFIPIQSNTNSHGSVCKPWSKTNSSSLDNEDEVSRVKSHSPMRRIVRTGSVSRTVDMFEQEQVSSSGRQQLSPGSRIVLPAANARPQNERIRKAFAFWNK